MGVQFSTISGSLFADCEERARIRMAYTSIESISNVGYTPPPIVPNVVPKSMGFDFLPAGTRILHDAGKWALYYNAGANVSYLVYDVGSSWRIKPVLGKVRVTYAKGVMAQKPCCQEE